MTDSEKSDLDAKVARAQGWQVFPYLMADGTSAWCPPGAEVHVSTIRPIPSVTTSWDAFGAALLWAAEKGLDVTIGVAPFPPTSPHQRWVVGVNQYDDERIWATDPRIALALAIAAWAKGKVSP